MAREKLHGVVGTMQHSESNALVDCNAGLGLFVEPVVILVARVEVDGEWDLAGRDLLRILVGGTIQTEDGLWTSLVEKIGENDRLSGRPQMRKEP